MDDMESQNPSPENARRVDGRKVCQLSNEAAELD